MDKDSFSAGLIVILVIVLTFCTAQYSRLNEQITDLKKAAAGRDALSKQLASSGLKLTERSAEIERLHGQIRVIGECMDGVFQALTGKIPDDNNDKIMPLLKTKWPKDLKRIVLMTAQVPCKRSYEIINESRMAQARSPASLSLEATVPSSR